MPQQFSYEMAATKLTADGLLLTEETDPVNEDTRMSSEEEDALLSEDWDEDVGNNKDNIPSAQRQEWKRESANDLRSLLSTKLRAYMLRDNE